MRIPGSCPCSLLARSQCSQSCASMSFHIPLSWSTLLPNSLRPSTPCPRNPTPPPAHEALPPADRLSRAHHRKQSLCSLCPAVKQLTPFLPQWVKRTFQRHRRGGARRQCACQMCCVSARESELWRERGCAPGKARYLRSLPLCLSVCLSLCLALSLSSSLSWRLLS